MKRFLLPLTLFVSLQTVAATEPADTETLLEIYEYCFTMQDPSQVDETALLTCINEELQFGDFTTFKTLAEVKAALGL
ncbi:MAG: hypothetical protein HWE10_11060 [Gammaproteobacteria bacterium]|nr:hypothetical protein [Gammaproteobacteria bacterium]